MAVPWGLALFVIGLLYGLLAAGKQDKGRLFKNGLLIGLVLALVLALIGFVSGVPAIGFRGALGILWTALILSLLFILGVWIGDLLEPKSRARRR